MRDLEIRGAVDILGINQHGSIRVVGMNHFLRMLNKTVEELQAGKMSTEKEAKADVKLEFVESAAGMAHEPMRESWIGFEPMRTQAVMNGDTVGSISWVVIPYVANQLGAPCMNVWGMGVQEKHRRKGIGAALVSQAMARSYALGARFASVGTQLWNAPAHATYVKIGFSPHCIVMGRALYLGEEDKE